MILELSAADGKEGMSAGGKVLIFPVPSSSGYHHLSSIFLGMGLEFDSDIIETLIKNYFLKHTSTSHAKRGHLTSSFQIKLYDLRQNMLI